MMHNKPPITNPHNTQDTQTPARPGTVGINGAHVREALAPRSSDVLKAMNNVALVRWTTPICVGAVARPELECRCFSWVCKAVGLRQVGFEVFHLSIFKLLLTPLIRYCRCAYGLWAKEVDHHPYLLLVVFERVKSGGLASGRLWSISFEHVQISDFYSVILQIHCHIRPPPCPAGTPLLSVSIDTTFNRKIFVGVDVTSTSSKG